MGKKKKIEIVKCRYPKCAKLHETTELPKEEAYRDDNSKRYYHPDCYHTMKTVTKIRDTFCKKIDPTLTGKQIGQVVVATHNIIFEKKVDVDFLLFALEYFVKYKPGALKYPNGLHYIIQDRDAKNAWKKYQEKKIKDEIEQEKQSVNKEDLDFTVINTEKSFKFVPQKQTSFADILR